MESCRWYALIGTTKSRPRHFLIWMRTVGQLQHADYRGGCMFKYACCWWTRQRIHNTLWKRSFSHWVFQRYQNFINIGGLTEEPQITHLISDGSVSDQERRKLCDVLHHWQSMFCDVIQMYNWLIPYQGICHNRLHPNSGQKEICSYYD